jgi:RNA polymerase sigma factor (sigma-70 family)
MNHQHVHDVDRNNGKYDEFKQIYIENKKHVFAIALSILKDFELSEDVLQEVFIKFFWQMKNEEIKNVKAWLIQLSRNKALDVYRKKKREIAGFTPEYFASIPFLAEDPLDKLILSNYLELLDNDERQIVILKDISGLKHREIAQILKKPLGTVLWKYRTALTKLRKNTQ